ncbi:hypothetical protein [Actinospica robiniae]|uniref:hypothetical protein n=1 Tax=Actinospica robiniae TaxID=304901 RepID=UPI000409317F|nr:hypothetical protein [Actinospica robiniae]
MGSQGTSLFTALLWFRTALAVVYVGVPALLVGVSVWWATRRSRRDAADGLGAVARRARHGRLTGLAAGAAAGVVAIWYAEGLVAPALVAIGYLFGVLRELLSVPVPSGPVRTALVVSRESNRYLPRWAVWVSVVTGVLCILTPLLFAVLPRVHYLPWSPDVAGQQFTIPGGSLSWPAAATSVPLAAVAACGIVAGTLLARRITLLPPLADDPVVDERLRCRIGRAGAGAMIGIELLALAALTIAASGGLAVPGVNGGAAYLASRIMLWTGLGLAVAAILAWSVLGARRLARVTADVAGGVVGA